MNQLRILHRLVSRLFSHLVLLVVCLATLKHCLLDLSFKSMSLRLFKQTAYQSEKEIAWSAFPATKRIYSRGSSRDWTNSSKKNLAPLKWRRGRRLSTSSWMFKSRFYKNFASCSATQA